MCQSCLHFLRAPNKWHFYEVLSKRRATRRRLRGLRPWARRLRLWVLSPPHGPIAAAISLELAGKELFLAAPSPPRPPAAEADLMEVVGAASWLCAGEWGGGGCRPPRTHRPLRSAPQLCLHNFVCGLFLMLLCKSANVPRNQWASVSPVPSLPVSVLGANPA